jgi:hypothetical protein
VAEARVTSVGAYVEKDSVNVVRVTGVGAYVEEDAVNTVRISGIGAYVEIIFPPSDAGLAITGLSSLSGIVQ